MFTIILKEQTFKFQIFFMSTQKKIEIKLVGGSSVSKYIMVSLLSIIYFIKNFITRLMANTLDWLTMPTIYELTRDNALDENIKVQVSLCLGFTEFIFG